MVMEARPLDAEPVRDLARGQLAVGQHVEDAQASLVTEGSGELHEAARRCRRVVLECLVRDGAQEDLGRADTRPARRTGGARMSGPRRCPRPSLGDRNRRRSGRLGGRRAADLHRTGAASCRRHVRGRRARSPQAPGRHGRPTPRRSRRLRVGPAPTRSSAVDPPSGGPADSGPARRAVRLWPPGRRQARARTRPLRPSIDWAPTRRRAADVGRRRAAGREALR